MKNCFFKFAGFVLGLIHGFVIISSFIYLIVTSWVGTYILFYPKYEEGINIIYSVSLLGLTFIFVVYSVVSKNFFRNVDK